jgi:hypothetical protein
MKENHGSDRDESALREAAQRVAQGTCCGLSVKTSTMVPQSTLGFAPVSPKSRCVLVSADSAFGRPGKVVGASL